MQDFTVPAQNFLNIWMLQNNTARNSVTQYEWQQETAYEHVHRLTFSNTNSIMCLKRLMELCKSEIQTRLVHVKINYFKSLHIS